MSTFSFKLSHEPHFETCRITVSGLRGFTPEGRIIATETLSFPRVSVQLVTRCDIPQVLEVGLATEVSQLLIVVADAFFSSFVSLLIIVAVAHGGAAVGVGKGRPRTK